MSKIPTATGRRQALRDFEINLKAELEILALHSKLDLLLARQGQAGISDGDTKAS